MVPMYVQYERLFHLPLQASTHESIQKMHLTNPAYDQKLR